MSDYTQTVSNEQTAVAAPKGFLVIPSSLDGFNNTQTTEHLSDSFRKVYWFHGELDLPEGKELVCDCGCTMHRNQKQKVRLRHVPIGSAFSDIYV